MDGGLIKVSSQTLSSLKNRSGGFEFLFMSRLCLRRPRQVVCELPLEFSEFHKEVFRQTFTRSSASFCLPSGKTSVGMKRRKINNNFLVYAIISL